MAGQDAGQWENDFNLETVAIHASLLPNGKVLYWGRRSNRNGSLNQPNPTSVATPQPKATDGSEVNLFCAGHCLQPDGSLLAVGGHITDSVGSNQTCVYNWKDGVWSPKAATSTGRWYSSALTLPYGGVFCISGSIQGQPRISTNDQPQILPFVTKNDSRSAVTSSAGVAWKPVTTCPTVPSLYPGLHLDPNGRIFIAGPQAESQFLDIGGARSPDGKVSDLWTSGPRRAAGGREYAPLVMYDKGKFIFIGGGNDADTNGPPTNMAEIIDLNEGNPQWRKTSSMRFGRRQHNATVLADGTVLVTGGTQGGGFNNLNIGSPIWAAELWDPATKQWTLMAEEENDRCYHSIALLLPDGRVLSAGGGEYAPDSPPSTTPNTPQFTLRNAWLFRPPYLFRPGRRPTILNAPHDIVYGNDFDVTIDSNDTIESASWVRLGSVTHSNNMNQSFRRLQKVKQQGSKVTFKTPASANGTPRGHYMLFLLRAASPPSVARIVKIAPAVSSVPRALRLLQQETIAPDDAISLPLVTEDLIAKQDRPPTVVDLTPVCPYGLGPCWGGALEALQNINDVDVVSPVPDQTNSVAFVYARPDVLPEIDIWQREFESTANGAYTMRGIEVTLSCALEKKHSGSDLPLLASTSTGQVLHLLPSTDESSVRWDGAKKAPKVMTPTEVGEYDRILGVLAERDDSLTVNVTGRLENYGVNAFTLYVRKFVEVGIDASALKL